MVKLPRSAAIIILAILFSVSIASGAITPAASQKNVKAPPVVKAGEVKIPSDFGRITEKFDAGGDKLVVHMQDAHTNYEAQKNAALILDDLINKYGLYLILVEGGSRDVSLNQYREQMSLEDRKKTAEESLKNGVIAGEEYLNIVSDYPMKLQGIEDRALYDENMKAFLEVDKLKQEALSYVKTISEAAANVKPKVYTKALQELDEKRIGFKEEKVTLNEYVNYLNALAKPQSAAKKNWFARIWEMILIFLSKIGLIKYTPPSRIDLAAYPNYKALMSSMEIEKGIDFAEVEKERADVIDLLSKKLNQNDLSELLNKSVDFKAAKITQAQYHSYLKDIMAKSKIGMKEYPNLNKYVQYVSLYEKIDSAALFKEMKALQSAIEQALAANEEQKRLLAIAKNLELMTEFIDLELTPDDFDYFKQNEGEFNAAAWVRFLNDQLAKYKLTQRVPENAGSIEKIIPHLKNFYTIARKRDDIFLNNTRKYMNEEGVNLSVLIAGGFHTPNLMKLFRENKISYIVVAPKVLKPTDEKLYHKILTEGWAPAEK